MRLGMASRCRSASDLAEPRVLAPDMIDGLEGWQEREPTVR